MTPIKESIINKKTKNKPIWLMRQAGRYLPEFRKIRKLNPNFINLCLNDNLSSKITLQPLQRFKLDAAIIFSDILMIPYGLNQKVEFKKNFGPKLGPLNLEKIYKVNEKSPIEWVMERQSITFDNDSEIYDDANVFANETINNPAYPLELLQRVITVSLETNRIVKLLPKLDI